MLSCFTKKEAASILTGLAEESSHSADPVILSYLYAKQAYLINPNSSRALEKFATALFGLKDYENALKCAEKWSQSPSDHTDQFAKADMYKIKGLCLMHLGKYDAAPEYLRKAMTSYIQMKEGQKVDEMKRIMEEELPRAKEAWHNKPASEKESECKMVRKYFELNEIPDVPGKMVYILPADWVEKWKEFNNYHQFVGEENDKRNNFMEEEREKIHWLGPIDPSNILVDEPCLIDSNPEEMYTNFQLKLGLEENKDFFHVSEEFWNYLYSKYGGIPIQRPTYRKSESYMSVSIETWLQKINVLLLPAPGKDQPDDLVKKDTIYISKRKTVKDLIEKLSDIYGKFFTKYDFKKAKNRIWKVDPRFDINSAWRNWEKGSFFEIQGAILDENISIEDSEISDEDKIVFETHFRTKDWFVTDMEESKQRSKSKEENNSMNLTSLKDFPSGAKKGLTGLQNLGNTCFMNSAIQCLSNTFDLTVFFLTNQYKKDVNVKNPLGSGGKLAHHYSELMKEMWFGSSSYVSPWELKKTIGKLASQFVGYGQQDSQELLSYLLDGLHEDLNRVIIKPVVETRDDDDREDEIVAQESWNNHLKRNQSKIQELMHGQFKSRLDCPDCGKVSITFDPYMMISLPIPTVEYAKFFLYFVFDNYEKIPSKITLNMPNNTLYPELLEKVSKLVGVPKKNIIMGLLKEHKLVEFVSSNVDAQYLKEHPGILFAYEIPSVNFVYNHKLGSHNGGRKDKSESGEISDGYTGHTESTRDSDRMEAENEGPLLSLPDTLIRVYIQAEPKAFYESEKTISYTRLIRIEPSDTYKDLHLKIYDRMRPQLFKYFEKQGTKHPIQIEKKSKMILEQEYNELFPEDNEAQWVYKVFMVNNAKEDAKTGKKATCELCQKSKCTRCLLPNEEGRVSNYMQKMGVQANDMVLEVKIASKTIKLENLPLNQCVEYRNEENDETNPHRNYNIYDCFDIFTRKERLEKNNAWYCSKCKGHKEAMKKMEIYKVPPVLILHLKRFKTSKVSSIGPYYWNSGKKINAQIDFPLDGLNLTKYVLGQDKDGAIYDLFAVSNHYGGLSGGHYTAYCKNPFTNKWYDFNDSRVSPVDSSEVVGAAAYTLFYRRRDQGSGK